MINHLERLNLCLIAIILLLLSLNVLHHSDLHDASKTPCVPPLLEQLPDTDIPSPLSPLVVYNSLSNSNSLFFIRYTPEDTFKQQWFLVQIDYDESTILKMKAESTGDYHVNFLARHPDDKHLCDDKARW